jgi:hypothetical protein
MSDCDKPDDCRIAVGIMSITDMHFPPVYDGYGNNLNPDGNVMYWTESCSTCGKIWQCSSQLGQKTRIDLGNQNERSKAS